MRYWETGTDTLLVGMKRGVAWQFLRRLNIELPCKPAISLPDIYPRERKTCLHENFCTLNIHSSVNYNNQKVKKKFKCPSGNE